MLELLLGNEISIQLMESRHSLVFFEFIERERARFEKWIPFVGRTKSEDHIRNLIMSYLDKLKNGTGVLYGIWDAKKIIGMIMVVDINQTAQWAEIGYMISGDYEGKGLVRKSVEKLIHFLFTEFNVQKIVLCCDERNMRSIGLAKALGFVHEGTLKRHSRVNGELCNLMYWAQFSESKSDASGGTK